LWGFGPPNSHWIGAYVLRGGKGEKGREKKGGTRGEVAPSFLK